MSSAQPAAGSGPAPSGSSDQLQDAMIAFNDEVFETLQKLLKAQQELVRAVIGAASAPESAGADKGGQDEHGPEESDADGEAQPEVIFPLDTETESPEGGGDGVAEADEGADAEAEEGADAEAEEVVDAEVEEAEGDEGPADEADGGAEDAVPPDADWVLDAEAAGGVDAE
jgi:hypothetical protein